MHHFDLKCVRIPYFFFYFELNSYFIIIFIQLVLNNVFPLKNKTLKLYLYDSKWVSFLISQVIN